jgi:hypothetical protein
MSCTPDPHYVSRRHPNGGAYHIFDEAKMSALIREWQQTGNENLFRDIIEGSLDMIQTIIRSYHFYNYDELDALTNDCILKLRQALPHYCADRGRSFSFITVTLRNFLIHQVQRICTYHRRHTSVEPESLENYLANNVAPNAHFNEFLPLLQKLQTRFHEPDLLKIQHRMVWHILKRGLWGTRNRILLLNQLIKEYGAGSSLQIQEPDTRHGVRHSIAYKKLNTLYNYVLIQLRRLFYDSYAPKPLPRPTDEKLSGLWDELGPAAFCPWSRRSFPVARKLTRQPSPELRAHHQRLYQSRN